MELPHEDFLYERACAVDATLIGDGLPRLDLCTCRAAYGKREGAPAFKIHEQKEHSMTHTRVGAEIAIVDEAKEPGTFLR